MEYKEIDYKIYGRSLLIKNDYLEVIVTLDLGPRVISLRRLDGQNVFFEDLQDLVQVHENEMEQLYYPGATWHGYGGHRLWKSMEDYTTYYPDNEKVDYQVSGKRFDFISKPQIHNEIQFTMSLIFEEDRQIRVFAKIQNTGNKSCKLGCWSLSMLKGPGLEIVPLPKNETGYKVQRHYSLWNYGAKNNDPRVYYGDKYFSLRMVPGNKLAYKVGMKIIDNHVLYMTKDDVIVKYFEYDDSVVYPDNNVNYETYTKDLFLEMETLGEYRELAPGASMEHFEVWSIKKNESKVPDSFDEALFDEIMAKYI